MSLGGRPPRAPGGNVGAVRRFLADRTGTRKEIVAATGYSITAVDKGLCALRRSGAPEIANLRFDPCGRPNRMAGKSRPAPVADEPLTAEQVVASAVATRSALEEAWR